MNVTINKVNQYVINLEIEYKKNPVIVNCQTGEITSYTGHKVNKMPTLLNSIGNQGVRLFVSRLNSLISVVKKLMAENFTSENPELYFNESQAYQRALKNYQAIETFLPVIDRVTEPIKENPKGYIKYILENNLTINARTLRMFKLTKGLNNLPEMYRKYWVTLAEYFADKYTLCNHLITTTIPERIAICKIFKVSNAHLGLSVGEDFCELFSIILTSEINWVEIVDTNRTARQNIKLISDYLDALENERFNKAMEETEKRIDKIAGLETDNFIVMVPHTLKELIEEGKMQNNCVGYYYNDTIEKGGNAIYFIRKKTSPDKSFITCRYHFSVEETVEKKTINNTWIAPQEAKDLIKMIDKMLEN